MKARRIQLELAGGEHHLASLQWGQNRVRHNHRDRMMCCGRPIQQPLGEPIRDFLPGRGGLGHLGPRIGWKLSLKEGMTARSRPLGCI